MKIADEIYKISLKDITGDEFLFERYRGKVVLIVNVASKCGFTYQYSHLEALYQKYKDQGLIILGFPCNQFGDQESGTETDIQTFCSINFGVTFPLFSKIDVNGTNAHPLYNYIKSQARGILWTKDIKWNFTKFLVSRDGKVVQRYAPREISKKLELDIVREIQKM